MKIEELHKSLTTLYVEWGSILDRIEHCKESFEDFLPKNLAEYTTAKNMCKDVLSFIQREIPIKCSCGSFEFIEQKIVVPKSRRYSKQYSYEHLKSRISYICIQCGLEIK